MKKSAIFSLLVALSLVGCSGITDNGPYTITGTLLNNCEKQEPVANKELYFLVDWDAPESERFATTDANGRFEYTFEGPPNNESVIGGSVRISNNNVILCGIPNFLSSKKMEAGVLYSSPPRKTDIRFKIQGAGFSDQDTLILSSSFHTDLRKISTTRIAGPFDQDTIFVREWIKYASSGNKTLSGYSGTTRPHTRRLYGTFGSKCYWQVRRNGQVYKANSESVLLEVCDNDGEITINPNIGYDDE